MFYECKGAKMAVEDNLITWISVSAYADIRGALRKIFDDHPEITVWKISTPEKGVAAFRNSHCPPGYLPCFVRAHLSVIFAKVYALPLTCEGIKLYLSDLRYAAAGTELLSDAYTFSIYEDSIDWVHHTWNIRASDTIVGYYTELDGPPIPVCSLRHPATEPVRFAVDATDVTYEPPILSVYRTDSGSRKVEADPDIKESKQYGNRVTEYLRYVSDVEIVRKRQHDDIHVFHKDLSADVTCFLLDHGYYMGRGGKSMYFFRQNILETGSHGIFHVVYPFLSSDDLPNSLPCALRGSRVFFK